MRERGRKRGAALAAVLATACLAAPPAQAQGAADALSPAQREAVLGLLRDALQQDPAILGEALKRNPAILRDALEALQQAELHDRETAARAAIVENARALYRDPADPVRGNPEGVVTLVEFFDARCGYCKQLHPAMAELIRRNPDLRVVLKDLPVLGPNSVLASRALLAAQRQGKYEPLYDALLRLREEPTEPVLRREAERAGLDWARLRRDMEDPAIARRLEQNLRLAGLLRVEGTPALVIGDRLVPGAVDLATLERLVTEEREKQQNNRPG